MCVTPLRTWRAMHLSKTLRQLFPMCAQKRDCWGRRLGFLAVCHSDYPTLHSPPISARGSLFSTSSLHLLVLVLLTMAMLTRVRWYLTRLDCFSLVMSDEEHFSRACWPFVHLLIRVVGPFSSRIVVLLSFRGSLCIQDPHPLSDT